jgi:hypothetical protein
MRQFPCHRALFVLLLAVSLTAFLVPATAQVVSDDQEQVQNQIERAKIFRDAYPIIADVDLYCSLFMLDGDLPELMITAGEKGYEKIMFSDGDIVFLNKGSQDGLEIGQVFLVIEVGEKIGGFGHLANKRGRAQVISLEDKRAIARIEKSCGRLMVGSYLLPFEEKETLLGKDIGYVAYGEQGNGPTGNLVYLERGYNVIGYGGWAIIDIGEEAGVQVGQQMTIYKKIRNPQSLTFRDDLPQVGVGNAVVIDAGKKTATIKILSCWDAIMMGQWVQGK